MLMLSVDRERAESAKLASTAPPTLHSPHPLQSQLPKHALAQVPLPAPALALPQGRAILQQKRKAVKCLGFQVKPGKTFSSLADVVVESAEKGAPGLGTLGDLRHIINTESPEKARIPFFLVYAS